MSEILIGDRQGYRLADSGDQTLRGTDNEHIFAKTFLHGVHQVRIGEMVGMGLDLNRDRVHLVPGNHDHWCGSILGGANPAGIAKHYIGYANPLRHFSPDRSLMVEVYGLDSFAEMPPGAATQLRQGGTVTQGALKRLQAAVEQNEALPDGVAGRIRIATCHHPLADDWTWNSNPFSKDWVWSQLEARVLDVRSQNELAQALANLGFHLILSGHRHEFHRRSHFAVTDQNEERELLEFEAGTTTQKCSDEGSQGYWAHHFTLNSDDRVELRPIKMIWESTDGQCGFVPEAGGRVTPFSF